MDSLEDTKPRSPFADAPPTRQGPLIQPPYDEEPPRRDGPGCVLYGLVGTGGLIFALVIVALAGAAGWTSGQRSAREQATATQQARVNEQLNFIPGDIASGNTIMLDARVKYLATLGVPNAPELAATATQLYLDLRPTITPTPEPTLPATAVPATPTGSAPLVVPTLERAGGGFDPAPVLQRAQQAMAQAQYEEAIDLLDTVIRIDPDYETRTVRALMLEALSTRALRLFRTGTSLAEAVLLTDRAKEFGLSGDSELHYEQYIAALYLTATSAVGTNYPAAISALREIYSQVPNYADVQQQLYRQYVGYGDALVAGGNYCAAVPQYQNALNMFADGGVSARRDNARRICEEGTPTPEGFMPETAPDGQPIAPIGQPGT
jgi:tetratricopeptide (TPR) repeat protein